MDTRVYAGYDDGLRIVDPETGGRSRSGWRTARSAVPLGRFWRRGPRLRGPRRRPSARRDVRRGAVPLDGRRRVLSSASPPRASVRAGPDPRRSPRSRRARTTPRSSGSERNPRGCIGRRTAARPSSESGADRGPLRVRVWSFPPRPDTHHVRWIEPCPADPERWFVGVEAGALVVTPDGGETWVDRPEGSRRDNHALATHPDAPNLVYAAAGDGFAESGDRGDSWRVVDRGLDHGYVWGLAVDPGDPETALVSAASGAGRRTAAARRTSTDDLGWRQSERRSGDDRGKWPRR